MDVIDQESKSSDGLKRLYNLTDIIKSMIALISSLIVIALYIVAMFINISLVYEAPAMMDKVFIYSFYSILILLIFFEVIPKHYSLRTYLFIIILLLVSLYMIIGALKEIQQLKPGYFFIIPPSLVIIRCSIPQNCMRFYAISFSIPLLLTFALLIYSIYTLLIHTRRTVLT